ncbi:MAG TPA: carboxypeptidase regulatory-like domain-containing protein, partial [Polyangiaceae bacterium]|nr:carboxypeptidase regulatory-like domain-containing protein [Polyangiaceae bacterium]
MLKSSKSSSNTSFNKKLRRRRFGGSGLSVWLVAGGTLLLPSEVWAFVVSGHVQTSGGAAVEGADISFDSGAEWGWASSGPDGSYSVNLPPDTYLLEVQPPHGSGLLPHSQSGVDVASDTTLDIVLAEPSPATYSGVLTDLSGAPIANARVEVVGNGEDVAGLTDASGAFSILTDTAAAMVQVSCDAYDDCSRFGANAYATWDLFIDLTGGSVTGAILEWPIYTLEGSVETSGSAPVADVPIAYYGSDHDYDTGQSFYVNFSGSADAQGLFSLSVTPGSGELRVTAPQGSGLLSALEDVFVSSADPSPVVVILEDALEYAGTLVDSHGTPIAGAWMTLQGGAFSYDGQTDETGAFSIQAGPDSDTISISCYGGDGCAHFGENAYAGLQDSVDLSAGSVTGAALVWPVRTLTGMVVDSQQAPVAGSNLSWNSNYYDEVTNQQITLSLSDQSTGADGAFSFLVSPGDGELNVTAPPASGLQNASMSVLVDGAVDPDPVTIALEPGVVYAGTLQDDAGNPIVGARVEVRDYDFSYYGTTDALGQFSVAASPQENDVDVTCDGYDGCTHFGASGSATLGGLSIDLSAGAILDAQLVWPVHELQCTVTDTDGLPVSDAYADWHSSGNDDATGVYYSNSDSQDTDADGKVTIRTSTGTG